MYAVVFKHDEDGSPRYLAGVGFAPHLATLPGGSTLYDDPSSAALAALRWKDSFRGNTCQGVKKMWED